MGQKRLGDPDFLYAASDTTACVAFFKESRMKLANATELNRKSGAQPLERFCWAAKEWLLRPAASGA
jgi:hypothetical protein